MFNALVLRQQEKNTLAAIEPLAPSDLPEGDVRVQVHYSTLNYKDALAITGKGPVVRSFPMIPGIDLAGEVLESQDPRWQVGDQVLVNGWGLGEVRWGALSEQISLKSEWLQPLPNGLTGRQCMMFGTAGYTAMLCVMALERYGIQADQGPVLVTGAAGGVGSVAVAILAKLGYEVHASSGRTSETAYLKGLGATEIIDRQSLSEPGRPLNKERWAAAIDSVGSHTLANVCASIHYGGAVAACGLAQGMDLPATVAPFILRGVALLGVESVYRPIPQRIQAWDRLAQLLNPEALSLISQEGGLEDAIPLAQQLLAGQLRGRCLIRVS